jgi:hypothetical protein
MALQESDKSYRDVDHSSRLCLRLPLRFTEAEVLQTLLAAENAHPEEQAN